MEDGEWKIEHGIWKMDNVYDSTFPFLKKHLIQISLRLYS